MQELLAKAAFVGPAAAALGLPAPRWHLIGGLQTNKVRLLGSVVHTVETVDRPSLVAELAAAVTWTASVEVQLDLAGSEGRSGCASDDVDELVDAGAGAPGLDVVGLMGVAAPRATVGDAEVGAQFRRLTVAADRLLGLEVRSMGMTDDLDPRSGGWFDDGTARYRSVRGAGGIRHDRTSESRSARDAARGVRILTGWGELVGGYDDATAESATLGGAEKRRSEWPA